MIKLEKIKYYSLASLMVLGCGIAVFGAVKSHDWFWAAAGTIEFVICVVLFGTIVIMDNRKG
jgi:hypothetical protein